jgi:hypothetical protein
MLVCLLFSSVPNVHSRTKFVDYPPMLDEEFEALKPKLVKAYGSVIWEHEDS